MGKRVAGASAPDTIGVAFILFLSLTSAGFSRGPAGENSVPGGFASIRDVGLKFDMPDVQTDNAKLQARFLRNLEIAEERFTFEQVYSPGIDVDPVSVPMFVAPSAMTPLTEKELIGQAVLRVAYAQYVVSLLAIKDVSPSVSSVIEQGVASTNDTEDMPIQIAIFESEFLMESNLVGDVFPLDISPDNIKPLFLDIVAPVPRMRRAMVENRSAPVSSLEVGALGFNPLPVQSAISYIDPLIIAPVPAPWSLRPVLEVRPADVSRVRAARDVSVDRLVHKNAQGSWPRRLDQINALRLGGNSAENRDGQRIANAGKLQQLPNGMVLVGANN